MLRKTVLMFLLLLSTLTLAQRPQLTLSGGVGLNGAGYYPVSAEAFGGVYWDTSKLFFDGTAGYATGGKSNDNDNTSSSGHTRSLQGYLLAKKGKYLFGAGTKWSKLYTPDYTKSALHPEVSIGRDFTATYVDKLVVSYLFSGTDTANALQGLEENAYWFFGKHVYAKITLGEYCFHATVIPVSAGGSPQSVASELANKNFTSQALAALGYRF